MSGPFGSQQWMYATETPPFYPYTIDNSCRFDNASYLYKSSMPAISVFTVSAWVKLTPVGAPYNYIFSGNGSSLYWGAAYDNNNKFYIWNGAAITSTAVYRDYSAWYHVVFTRDGSGNAKLYINGDEVVSTTISQAIYSGSSVRVGSYYSGTNTINFFSGYMADYHFVDGTVYAPTDFAQYDTQTGTIWQPKAFSGSYGTNGFHLDFADNTSATTLGYDVSGNSNNFTPSGIATSDQMLDSPTNNFCTINPLKIGSVTLSEGNLKHQHSGSTSWRGITPTMHVSSGKWYWEVAFSNLYTPPASTTRALVGIVSENETQTNVTAATYWTGITAEAYGYYNYGGSIWNNNSGTAYGSTWGNATIGIALDLDSSPKTLEFFLNGVSQGVLQDGTHINLGDKAWGPGASTYYSSIASYNFGQFDFTYTPPSGFLALSSANLPDPTFDPRVGASPQDAFNTVLWTGDGTTPRSITGLGFEPSFTWIKCRSSVNSFFNVLTDAVRGTNSQLFSNSTLAEETRTDRILSFDVDGFSVGNKNDVNNSGDTFVAWNWKANGAGVANTDGTISSTVSANQKAGFSIVSFVNASSTNQETVGHGLGAAPKLIIYKNRDNAVNNWGVFHSSVCDSTSKFLILNSSNALATYNTVWGAALPDADVFGVTGGGFAVASVNVIAYCFAEVEGFSKFGSYTGNSSSDGPFIYTGFRPAFVIVKRTDTTANWIMMDNARDSYNVADAVLYPNLSNAEATADETDFLSNGFKLRHTDADGNASGGTYVYMAFAENPFKYSNAR